MTIAILKYLLIVSIYIPGLWLIINKNRFQIFPLLTCCFIGMLLFHAAGSIFVIAPQLLKLQNNFFSDEYMIMLIIQILIYYITASTYMFCIRKNTNLNKKPYVGNPACIFLLFLTFLSISGIFLFIKIEGTPLLIKLIGGQFEGMNPDAIIKYRTKTFYSGQFPAIYHISMIVIPQMIVIGLMYLRHFGTISKLNFYLGLFYCFLAVSLMGGKGNLLYIILAIGISYFTFCTMFSIRKTIKFFSLTCVAIFPILGYFFKCYKYSDFIKPFFYRLFVAYTEAIAATVFFVDKYGTLNFRTLPNLRGLLSHVPVRLESMMHLFMTRFEGSWPVPAVAEGYVNLGFLGFVFMGFLGFGTVVFLEEVFYRLPNNICNRTLQVHCSILSMYLAIHGYFGSFLSLTYFALYIFLFFSYKMIFATFKKPV